MAISLPRRYRMGAACRLVRDLVVSNPVKQDVFRDYEAVQAWPLVTALYNGIEQALKMLLLIPSNTQFTLEDLREPEYGHNLAKLYAELAAEDREHIELHFREHRSLHDYMPTSWAGTAKDFIDHINSSPQEEKKKGLISWRYILLDGPEPVPPTSLWTMSEIWDAICCRIRKASGKNDCSRLSERLAFTFRSIVTGRAVPPEYDGYLGDLNRWTAHKDGDQAAAWIDLLVKASRDAMHEVQAPDRLRPILADMARQAIDNLSRESANPDDVQLLQRITAHRTDPGLGSRQRRVPLKTELTVAPSGLGSTVPL